MKTRKINQDNRCSCPVSTRSPPKYEYIRSITPWAHFLGKKETFFVNCILYFINDGMKWKYLNIRFNEPTVFFFFFLFFFFVLTDQLLCWTENLSIKIGFWLMTYNYFHPLKEQWELLVCVPPTLKFSVLPFGPQSIFMALVHLWE
jgi:spore maturation protein CgeB